MKKYTLSVPKGPPRFRVDYERELNEQQLAVVMAGEGLLLVIAGAGSGKTRTLTYRVARLIESGVPPQSILLVTFTNKAAREMLRRVEGLIQADVRRVVGGTFHHVANLLLRRHADLLGYGENFTIIDRADAKDLMDSLIAPRRKLMEHKKFPKGDVVEEILSFAINTRQPLGRVITERFPVFMEIADELAQVCDQYAAAKKASNVMDFDDLLVHWARLIAEHPELAERYRRQFRAILVDEYQDTNKLQTQIVESIAGPDGNLMVVGDDAQSIYSFRGANFGNIIDFPKRFPAARIFKLETNYRSTPQVLDLANQSIVHNERQFPKTLRAHRGPGPVPEVVSAGSPAEQAQFVADRIVALRDEGIDLDDAAVLYRAHWHSMELQMELQHRGIPFQVRSGMRFFEQAHIKDVTAYLRIIANPRDALSWQRVLRLYAGIGRRTAATITASACGSGDPIAWVRAPQTESRLPSRARGSWREFRGLVGRVADLKAPGEAIRAVLEGGYDEYLAANFANAVARAEDIRRLADFAVRFADIPAFLSELVLTTNVVGEEMIDEPEPTEALVLSTVHQAKGLEWKAVFVIWLVDGKFPDARSLREEGAGEEEERRLFYVACTRAKDLLYLTYPAIADERQMLGVLQRPSRFVDELPERVYGRASAEPDIGEIDVNDE
jgi:DNA helicase-2/ATP-dependent DNA helicase PcrA